MEYHEAAASLQSLQRHRPKLGVGTTQRMLEALGDPQEAVDFVQIAGSNGKGSTARMLESVLRKAGLRVGVFTSPAMSDFRDQIRVDGQSIPKERVRAFVEEVDPVLDRLRADDDEPTHFEVLTALAITHLGREGVDVGILEVGIGGRYDATSAIDPVASAVTSVSLEHTDLLGETVEEIARDKAQVAPADAPLVTGATGDALAAIRAETDVVTVAPTDADVRAVETGMRSAIENTVSITGPDWALETNLSLLGQHQATNAGVAATLARQVEDVDTGTLAVGLRTATWPGRFEIVERDPMVVLDGAHNPAATATLDSICTRYDYDDLHLVFGAMADKDHDGMVAALPSPAAAYLTRPETDRAAAPDVLRDAFESSEGAIHLVDSVAEATERALAGAGDDDLVLITGSLYVVAEARERWTRTVVPKGNPRALRPRAVFGDAAFPEADAREVDVRVLGTALRPDQARLVHDRLTDGGGRCLRSATAPGDSVATILGGSVPALRDLASALREEGLGLAHLAKQLEFQLADDRQPSPVPGPGTAVMGILNVTPDSFHDGGEYRQVDAAVARAREMVAAGADIVDVGGESTRPGAEPVSTAEERERIVPVIEAIADLEVPISVDTRKASVADAALSAGADVVNDVSGLEDPDMRFVVADHDAGLVLMHSVSAPVEPGRTRRYDDVVREVREELTELVLYAERAGIDRDKLIVDPGCGFGKRPADSFELVDRVHEFGALETAVMIGHSRKSMFDAIGSGSGNRLPPTLGLTALAADRGVDVVRVHDVEENAAVVRAVDQLNRP